MRSTPRTLTALASAALLGLGAIAGVAASASAAPGGSSSDKRHDGWADDNKAVGLLSDGLGLRVFELNNPRDDDKIGTVSGLAGDTRLIGIDYRVQDRLFYGVGEAGGVYTLDSKTAVATKVSELTVALSGTNFGVDFNPAADRLRVISDNGQNLRHNVNVGGTTIADTPLAYTPGTPAAGLTAAGYTNNDLSASTATTLIDIDTSLDQVALQVPANNGTLSATGLLGINVAPVAGFDILSSLSSGVTDRNQGYAVLRSEGTSRSSLYKVDVLTGDLARVGSFDQSVVDLAVTQER